MPLKTRRVEQIGDWIYGWGAQIARLASGCCLFFGLEGIPSFRVEGANGRMDRKIARKLAIFDKCANVITASRAVSMMPLVPVFSRKM